ncbi:phage holin family protein [Arthrobacter oryzae]|uniref:Phage holin family protein n=2 Tax=Arthrobacter TaxID=1663 RepID=A0A3N0BVX2_9MICC|nr:phage holin family protein [Arthrobacter oryzae]
MPPTTAHAKAESVSLGDLLGEVTRDMSTLMRQEVELAKVELKDSAARAGKGTGMLAGAGVAGHFVLLFLSLALWWALGTLLGLGWSGVVVAVVWGLVAAVLAAMGRKELKAIKGLPQTSETLQEIPPTFKPNS